MEVYILDSLLRRDTVVDIFESMIWTERWKDIGDFELLIVSTPTNRIRFKAGTQITTNLSKRVMTAETVEDVIDTDGRAILKVKGRSLETLLEDRVALGTAGAGNFVTPWYIQDTPDNVMRQMFSYICIMGEVHPSDVIPFIADSPLTTLYPADNIPTPAFEIMHEQPMTSLYDAMKNVADIYDLGFRLYRDPAGSKLYFNVYSGSDRTNLQSIIPAVVFSSEFENLQNVRTLTTIEKTKNVAYVFYTQVVDGYPQIMNYQIVYADGADPNTAGFERRALPIEVTSLPEGTVDIDAYLVRKGKDELAKARPSSLLDGEVSQHSTYKYEVHYFLGDLVTMQNRDGVANSMRVTEQIFVHDADGERSYPTLITQQFIDPGSWLSWKYNKVWADMGATEFWNTQ